MLKKRMIKKKLANMKMKNLHSQGTFSINEIINRKEKENLPCDTVKEANRLIPMSKEKRISDSWNFKFQRIQS